mgnify:CR=1 FL=1
MKHYNAENHAKNLPDVYKKTPNSNNYKILEIGRLSKLNLRSDLKDIDDILSLDNATGKTLDLYGERLGQKRGKASDAQYLIMLKAKIMRNMSNGSYNSIIKAVCETFSCSPSEIIVEEAETPCTIKTLSVPISIINKAGLSSSQAHQIIRSLLPIGIRLDEYLLEGTFCFAENEDEYDEAAGFAFEENAGAADVGGYLGATGSDSNEEVLPID